jgi:hypothetical protein
LALELWGLTHDNPWAAGLGIVIAGTKYQVGMPAALAIWALYGGSISNRLRAFIFPTVVGMLSLAIYPFWPLKVLETVRYFPPNDWGSITLWRWLGPFALVFWLPPILLPLHRDQRFLALVAAFPLAVPYFQQTDLLLLFALPVGWLPLSGDLGALYKLVGWGVMQILVIIPFIIYGKAIILGIQSILYPVLISLNRNNLQG